MKFSKKIYIILNILATAIVLMDSFVYKTGPWSISPISIKLLLLLTVAGGVHWFTKVIRDFRQEGLSMTIINLILIWFCTPFICILGMVLGSILSNLLI